VWDGMVGCLTKNLYFFVDCNDWLSSDSHLYSNAAVQGDLYSAQDTLSIFQKITNR
jgi:hypothetical protein